MKRQFLRPLRSLGYVIPTAAQRSGGNSVLPHWMYPQHSSPSGFHPQRASRSRFAACLAMAAFTLLTIAHGAAQQPAQKSPTQPSIAQSAPIPTASPHPTPFRFVIVLDPAHGGQDHGAILAPGSPEKAYTLAFAVRLHVLLNAGGIPSILTRDSDTTLDSDARATAANRAEAAACILLHASSTGNGVHLFTSSLAVAGRKAPQVPRRTFLPWQTAQAGFGTESLRLESDLNTALANQHIPVLLDRTSLPPLDSMACPAVAVEVAPLDASTPLSDMAYQEKIARALAAGLIAWRSDWRLQP